MGRCCVFFFFLLFLFSYTLLCFLFLFYEEALFFCLPSHLLSSSPPSGCGDHLSHSGHQRAQLAGLYSPGEQVRTLGSTIVYSLCDLHIIHVHLVTLCFFESVLFCILFFLDLDVTLFENVKFILFVTPENIMADSCFCKLFLFVFVFSPVQGSGNDHRSFGVQPVVH